MLGAPKLKEIAAKEHVEGVETTLRPYQATIGGIELVLGVIALLMRMGILRLNFYEFGASYPQALIAIAIGLIMSAQYFEKFPGVMKLITAMKPYEVWIGLGGIAIGLGSILFGCPFCGYYY